MTYVRYACLVALLTLCSLATASEKTAPLLDAIISAPSERIAFSLIQRASASIAASSDKNAESYSSLAYAKEAYLQRFEIPEDTSISLRVSILSDYLAASAMDAEKERISHTEKLYEYLTRYGTYDEAKEAFEKVLSVNLPEHEKYMGRIDAARTAAHFGHHIEAEKQFSLAIATREPVDATEAHYLYAKYLLEKARYEEALTVLDRYTKEERALFIHLALLRQKVAQAMNDHPG